VNVAETTAAASQGLRLISPSQVNLYRECARKWAWKYIAKFFEPQGEAQKLGDEIEREQLQPYLLEGRPFDFSRPSNSGLFAAELLPYLPQPKTPGLEMQKHLVIPSPTWINGEHVGFGFQGFVDLWAPDSGVVPDMPGGRPFVGDFKSKKDLKWALNEEQLAKDVQQNLYSFATMYLTGAREVDVAWMNTQTKGTKKATRVKLRVVADQVAEQFGLINETAIEMNGIRNANPSPLDLPPNVDMCEAFSGCLHRDKCNLSPAQIIEAHAAKASRALGLVVEGEAMSNAPNQTAALLQNLAARRPGAPEQPPVQQFAPPAQQFAPPAQQLPPAYAAPPPVQVGSPVPLPFVQPAPAQVAPVQVAQPPAPPVQFAPPQQPVFAPPPVQLAPPPAAPTVDQWVQQNPNAGWLTQQPVAAPINPPESALPPAPPVNAAPVAPPPAEAPKRGRGRPAKSETAAAPVNGIDLDDAVRFAKALRDGCDAFIRAMETS
jgi:hypothetical protein